MIYNRIQIIFEEGRATGRPPTLCENMTCGSHMTQLVGYWTHNPRVVGLIPTEKTDANCFTWDNVLGQDVNLDCASLNTGEIWLPSYKGYWLLHLEWPQ